MRRIRLRVDLLLFLGLLTIAALVRLAGLDRLPLDYDEATLALRAAESTLHASPFWTENQPQGSVSALYQVGTVPIFSFTGASTASARILPALAGLALVCLPYLFRRKLGVWRALVLMACFTLSPTLITLSRSAQGTQFAVLGLGLALLLSWNGEDPAATSAGSWAAVGLGLALTAGASTLDGLLTLAIGFALLVVLRFTTMTRLIRAVRERWTGRQSLLGLAVAFILAGGFGLTLENLSAFGEAISVWLGGWRHVGVIHPVTSLFMIAAYAPLAVVFGILGSVDAFRRREVPGALAACWALSGSLLLLLYPGRSGSHLVWVVVPLLYVASSYLTQLIREIFSQRDWLEFFGVFTAILILLVFSYLQLAAYAAGVGPAIDPLDAGLRLLMAGGILFMAGMVVVLFGLGWSWRLSLDGLGAAGGLALVALSVMSIWRLNFDTSAAGSSELWRPRAPGPSLPLLVESIEVLSQATTGREDGLPLKVIGTAPPELAWALRALRAPSSGVGANQDPEPLILFKDDKGPPPLFSEYTGQGFDAIERWAWRGAVPPQPIRWWVRRSLPVSGEHWVLLVRLDVAALGEGQNLEAETP